MAKLLQRKIKTCQDCPHGVNDCPYPISGIFKEIPPPASCPLPDYTPPPPEIIKLPDPDVIAELVRHFLEDADISLDNENINSDPALQGAFERLGIPHEELHWIGKTELRQRLKPTWDALLGITKLTQLRDYIKNELSKLDPVTSSSRDIFSAYEDGRYDTLKEIHDKFTETLR